MAIARLWRNAPHLKALKKSSAKQRKNIISKGKADLINCICDCCLNLVNGNLKVNKVQRKTLIHHAADIRALSKKGKSFKKRKEILVQRGGFIPALLTPVLTLIASALVRKLLKRK